MGISNYQNNDTQFLTKMIMGRFDYYSELNLIVLGLNLLRTKLQRTEVNLIMTKL